MEGSRKVIIAQFWLRIDTLKRHCKSRHELNKYLEKEVKVFSLAYCLKITLDCHAEIHTGRVLRNTGQNLAPVPTPLTPAVGGEREIYHTNYAEDCSATKAFLSKHTTQHNQKIRQEKKQYGVPHYLHYTIYQFLSSHLRMLSKFGSIFPFALLRLLEYAHAHVWSADFFFWRGGGGHLVGPCL